MEKDALRDELINAGVTSTFVRAAAANALQQVIAARHVASAAGVPQDVGTLVALAQVIATNCLSLETKRAA